MKFHLGKDDEKKVAEGNETLDCDKTHTITKGDIFYILYDHEIPVMWVCKDCVIIDNKEE
jgi:hypothetical protein